MIRKIEVEKRKLLAARTHFQERMYSKEEDRAHNITRADASMAQTAEWRLLPDCKGFMAKPHLWDPTGEAWNTTAHWPLYMQVGSDKGRGVEANRTRNETDAARMHITLYRAQRGDVEWAEYGRSVARAMQSRHGPPNEGQRSWQAYGEHKAKSMKAQGKGKGKSKSKNKSKSKSKN